MGKLHVWNSLEEASPSAGLPGGCGGWVGRDALKELASPAVMRGLAARRREAEG